MLIEVSCHLGSDTEAFCSSFIPSGLQERTTKRNIDRDAVCDGHGVFQVEKVSKVFVHPEKKYSNKNILIP